MKRFLIVNIFEDCECTTYTTDQMRVMNIDCERAERIKDWACGLEINSLNVFCELSPEATLYVISRCRNPQGGIKPLIQYTPFGLQDRRGDYIFSLEQDLREWIEGAYCG